MTYEILLQIGIFRQATGITPDTININPITLRNEFPFPAFQHLNDTRCFGLKVVRTYDMEIGKFEVTASLKAFSK